MSFVKFDFIQGPTYCLDTQQEPSWFYDTTIGQVNAGINLGVNFNTAAVNTDIVAS